MSGTHSSLDYVGLRFTVQIEGFFFVCLFCCFGNEGIIYEQDQETPLGIESGEMAVTQGELRL